MNKLTSNSNFNPNNLWTCGVCDDSIVEEYEINIHYCITKYRSRCPKIVKIPPWKKFYPQTLDKKVLVLEFKDGQEAITEVPIQQILSGEKKGEEKEMNDEERSVKQKVKKSNKNISKTTAVKPKKVTYSKKKQNVSGDESSDDEEEEEEEEEEINNDNQQLNFNNKPEFNEKFIQSVYESPAIWDPRMQLDEKAREKKDAAWEAISKNFNLTIEESRQKWKNLVDTRRAHIKKLKTTTGQARKQIKKWAHMESMKFLDDVDLNKQKTVTNLESNPDSECENIDPEETPKRRSRNKEEAIDNLAEAIKNSVPIIQLPEAPNLFPPIPSPPAPTEIECFSSLIGCKIKKLPEEEQEDVMEEILDLLKKKRRKES